MNIKASIVFLIAYAQLSESLVISDSHVASSCIYFLRKKSWDCSAIGGHMSTSTWNCQCYNVNWLGSITTCIYDYANSTQERNHGYTHIVKRCNVKALTDYTLEDMEFYRANATKYLEDSTVFAAGINVTSPISIDESTFAWWYSSFKDYNSFISTCQRLGWGCVGFWIGIVGLSGIYNYIGYRFVPFRITQAVNRLLTYRHDSGFFGLNRLEAIICFLFSVQVLLMCCINYSLELNSYLNSRWFLLLDLISFRTDIIAFSLMPVLYLMGIRNNPFQQFGLISHATMIKFHKVVAIVFFILALVHSIIWTHYSRTPDGGGYSVWAADAYFYWGIVGTIVIGLMLGFSIQFFRNLFYEVFLFFHLSFSVLFVAAMWKHCETLGWMGWVYSMAGILVFDWVARAFSIIRNGAINTAKFELYGEDLIKLDIVKPYALKFYPGAYVYLHFLSPVVFAFQSHPFSLVRSIESKDNLVMYLKCKKGITKRLASLRNRSTIKILIDGPYGNFPMKTMNDKGFDKVIGIGGGLGIASVLTFFNYRVSQMNESSFSNYHLKWLINDLKQLELVKDNLESLKGYGIGIDIYCTKADESISDSNARSSEEKIDTSDSVSMTKSGLNVRYGRPSIDVLLPQEATSKRRIYVCGPEGLTRDIRNNLSICDELIDEQHSW